MVKIDGSYGEGGGQILRTAIGLSVLTDKDVEVFNIRANRSNPGLRPQHYTAIKIMKEICNGNVEGLRVGSSRIVFHPGSLSQGSYSFDIGTAGSITLVFQTFLLGTLKTEDEIKLALTGGTDVKWSPPWDFFEKVFLKNIDGIGIKTDSRLLKRGYYPKGGGKAEVSIKPVEDDKNIDFNDKKYFKDLEGIVHNSKLPSHISRRLKNTTKKYFVNKGFENYRINIEENESYSPGVGITIWVTSEDMVLGSGFLGEKGVPAEKVAEKTFSQLYLDILSKADFDIHCSDQIIPFLGFSCLKNDCCYRFKVREITGHAETNMHIVEKFLPVKFKVNNLDENQVVNVSKK
ncbi:MAG: RNA 3'-terminal phosphate cyclase [Candidatus Thermoplasmatota archaeon]